MAKAIERVIGELAYPITDDRDYKAMDAKTSALFRELNALWSNPADADEAARLKNRLAAAWNKAIG
jgi:hypothetical protein